jgi:hypothetical protein
MAEAVRFELTDGLPSPVFKTGAINPSATLPRGWGGISPSARGWEVGLAGGCGGGDRAAGAGDDESAARRVDKGGAIG